MTIRPLSVLVLVALTFGAAGPAPAAAAVQPKLAAARAMPARPAPAQAASPASLLQADGTLRLDGQFSGSLDLKGWHVQLDPKRGPVFDPQGGPGHTVPPGQWANLGGGGSPLDDRVNALAVSGSTVYVAGAFLDADSRGHGADYIVKWDGSNWSPLDPNVSFAGEVDVLAVIGNTVYAGGDFAEIEGSSGPIPGTANIAGWNGSSWSALAGNGAGGSSLNGPVYAIAITGTAVYVGGGFTDVNSKGTVLGAADYVAKWDVTTGDWSALGYGANTNTGALRDPSSSFPVVYVIAVHGSDVYVGGQITDVNNKGTNLLAADYLAKWNSTTGDWSALSAGAGGNGALNAEVDALAFDASGNLYAGGRFTDVHVGSLALPSADYIAMWDGSWHSLGSSLTGPNNGSLNGWVASILVSGSNVYVGGDFTDVNDYGNVLGAADYLAKFDAVSQHWSALGGNGAGDGALPPSGIVSALALDGTGHLFVGGGFDRVNNGSSVLANASRVAEWTGAGWAALPGRSNGAINSGYNDQVFAIAVSGSDVYVGGYFTDLHDGNTISTAADYIAKWDGTHWWALGQGTSGDGALNSYVEAIVVSGTTVYVGGGFTDVDNGGTVINAADYVAQWDGAHWSALGQGAAGNGSLNAAVYALAVAGPKLYVGGEFADVNNNGLVLNAADCIAAWDGADWSALGHGAGGNGALNAMVHTIAVTGTTVYVGGSFTNVSDNGAPLNAADYIAKWDGAHWSALGQGAAGNGALSGQVYALALSGNNVYVGGGFPGLNNKGTPVPAAAYVAKWDATTGDWSALGHGANSTTGALNNFVRALAVSGNHLYAGGDFTDANNSGTVLGAADYVAQWDGAAWSALGSDGAGDGALNNYVYPGRISALSAMDQNLYVGGRFFDVSNNGAPLAAADTIAGYGIGQAVYLPLVRR